MKTPSTTAETLNIKAKRSMLVPITKPIRMITFIPKIPTKNYLLQILKKSMQDAFFQKFRVQS